MTELEGKLTLLEEAPTLGAPLPRSLDARRLLLDRFPYAVIYVELPTEHLLVAVAHLRREPMYLVGRLVLGEE